MLKNETVNRICFMWDSINIDTFNYVGLNGMIPMGLANDSYIFNDKLYSGGELLENSGYVLLKNLVHWNDTSWLPVGEIGNPNSIVYAMEEYNEMLFIGGAFTVIGSEEFDHIAAWDGEQWQHVDVGFGGTMTGVEDLVVYNGELIAGGMIAVPGGALDYIAAYDGTEWKDIGNGVSDCVYGLCTDTINNFLYAGGVFTFVDDSFYANGIARWNGFYWENVCEFNDVICGPLEMCFYRNKLFAGGIYINGSDTINGIAYFENDKWHPLNVLDGTNGGVHALSEYKDELYIGGIFTQAGGQPATGLAKWYMPEDTSCYYLMPRVFSTTDEYYLSGGEVELQFFNNNAYVNSWQWDFGDSGTANVKDPMHIYTATGDYNVQVTVTDGACVKTASKTIHVLLGDEIPEIENIDFKIYPNPSDGMVYVELGNSQSATWTSQGATQSRTLTKREGLTLRITGLNGHTKTTIPVTNEKTAINTNGWAKGTYLVNLFVGGKLVRTEKLVVE